MLDQSYFHTAQFLSIEHKKRFIDYNFFSCGNRQKRSLSTYRNMMILQILSHKLEMSTAQRTRGARAPRNFLIKFTAPCAPCNREIVLNFCKFRSHSGALEAD